MTIERLDYCKFCKIMAVTQTTIVLDAISDDTLAAQ